MSAHSSTRYGVTGPSPWKAKVGTSGAGSAAKHVLDQPNPRILSKSKRSCSQTLQAWDDPPVLNPSRPESVEIQRPAKLLPAKLTLEGSIYDVYE